MSGRDELRFWIDYENVGEPGLEDLEYLYLGPLKRFGRADGTKIYRTLKRANAA